MAISSARQLSNRWKQAQNRPMMAEAGFGGGYSKVGFRPGYCAYAAFPDEWLWAAAMAERRRRNGPREVGTLNAFILRHLRHW